MADNVDITAGAGTTIATDDCTTGQVQVVKLAYGADGDRTHVPADADGMLVNLGANNDISGTVTANLSATDNAVLDAIEADTTTIAGAVAGSEMQVDVITLPALPAGTNNIGDVDVLTMPNVTLAAGTNTNEVVGDVAHDVAAAGNPVLMGGYSSAAAPSDTAADGRAARAWFLRNGAQAVNITAAGALIPGDASNGLDVDVTRLPALVAGTANIGDVDVLTVPADPFGVNADAASATGSISAKLRFIAATGIPVTALPASTNTIEVVGDVAADVAAAGNPVLIAGISQDQDDTAPPGAATAEGRATRFATDRDGALFVHPHGPRCWSTVNTGALSATSVKSAPAAGLSLFITGMQFSIGAATASTIKLTISGGADLVGPHYLEAVNGRGIAITFNPPLKVTAATALVATTSGATTCTLNVQGYTAAG